MSYRELNYNILSTFYRFSLFDGINLFPNFRLGVFSTLDILQNFLVSLFAFSVALDAQREQRDTHFPPRELSHHGQHYSGTGKDPDQNVSADEAIHGNIEY